VGSYGILHSRSGAAGLFLFPSILNIHLLSTNN
jgi:hypothetical protein